jgi:hypothetical protein
MQPRELRQGRVLRQRLRRRPRRDPCSLRRIRSSPAKAHRRTAHRRARLDRLARAAQVAGPHGVHEGHQPGQFLTGGVLGQVLGDVGRHVPFDRARHSRRRRSRSGADCPDRRGGRVRNTRGLPVVAVAHGEARRQVGPGKPGSVLRHRGGAAPPIPPDKGRKHDERLISRTRGIAVSSLVEPETRPPPHRGQRTAASRREVRGHRFVGDAESGHPGHRAIRVTCSDSSARRRPAARSSGCSATDP